MEKEERISMNIVNQLFDIAEVPVKKRQKINDRCTDFVTELLQEKFKQPELENCECGHVVPLEFSVSDDDGNSTCMPCYIDFLNTNPQLTV